MRGGTEYAPPLYGLTIHREFSNVGNNVSYPRQDALKNANAALDLDAASSPSVEVLAQKHVKAREGLFVDWSIQEIAKITGTTSRTLRHYDDVGLLKPSRFGRNGYRYYSQDALVHLQRILLLRDLGLGLPAIAAVLRNEQDEAKALMGHLDWLRGEQDRLERQIASVERTLEAVKRGGHIMAEDMFEGFVHTGYKDEVEERWGKDAYVTGDQWWRSMTTNQRKEWQDRASRLGSDWIEAAESGITPDSDVAQALAERHVDWLTSIPGTPAFADGKSGTTSDVRGYITGLSEMYVSDSRFGANYGGRQGAEFVRDALRIYADATLTGGVEGR